MVIKPSVEALFDFQRRTLGLPCADQSQTDAEWKLLKQQPVFRWLSSHHSYEAAVKELQTLAGYREAKKRGLSDSWQLSQFSGLVAYSIGTYFLAEERPERVKVLRNSERKQPLGPISLLVEQIRKGNGLLIPGQTATLLALLQAWQDEITKRVPTGLPKKRASHLPIRLLMRTLARVLLVDYDHAPSRILVEIASIVVDTSANERTALRVIAELKDEKDARARAIADTKLPKS